ncbi:hypothetical protein FRC09_009773 [Ceratobasidium sp. 395]|nr:hypothetical protein FRC09_009773 [Ceratobasidium sp. 395]
MSNLVDECERHRDLIKCFECSIAYCHQSGTAGGTACLTLCTEPYEDFRCRACHAVHFGDTGLEWPSLRPGKHQLRSPRTRFRERDYEGCPDRVHTNCVGLAVTIVFETGDQATAELFAQLLRGRWESNGWPLSIVLWNVGGRTIGREVRLQKTKKKTNERGGSAHKGAYCRTLVVYLASETGLVSTVPNNAGLFELIANGKARFPLEMETSQVHAMLVFMSSSVPTSRSFVTKFQDAVDDEGCPFKHVVLYSTRGPRCPVHEAFGPAVTAIISCWGQSRLIGRSVVSAWTIDRWAQDIVVTIGEKGEPARLRFRLNFAVHGWKTQSRLELCACQSTGGQPKAWEFVNTDNTGAPTTATIKCTSCEVKQVLVKPSNMPTPLYESGAWFREIGSEATGS